MNPPPEVQIPPAQLINGLQPLGQGVPTANSLGRHDSRTDSDAMLDLISTRAESSSFTSEELRD